MIIAREIAKKTGRCIWAENFSKSVGSGNRA